MFLRTFCSILVMRRLLIFAKIARPSVVSFVEPFGASKLRLLEVGCDSLKRCSEILGVELR